MIFDRELPGQLGFTVSRLRSARGLTQRELAARSGSRQPRISEIESGRVDIMLREIVAITSVLDVRISEFFALADGRVDIDLYCSRMLPFRLSGEPDARS